MKKAFYILLLTISMLGCKQEKKKENLKNTSPLEAGCYGYEKEGTTITFRITRVDPLIQGTLIYNWAEKDRNSGSFNGTIDKNIILGTYTFISEGVESSREVAFKIDQNTLTEGYGEVKSAGKLITYKNIDDLKYDSQIVLTLGSCTN